MTEQFVCSIGSLSEDLQKNIYVPKKIILRPEMDKIYILRFCLWNAVDMGGICGGSVLALQFHDLDIYYLTSTFCVPSLKFL